MPHAMRHALSTMRSFFPVSIRAGFFLLWAVLLICCGEKKDPSAWTGPVRFAVVAPTTGFLEKEGQMLQLGALMAVREAQGRVDGFSVEIVAHDSPCDANEARSIARRLVADSSVCAVIGYLCGESILAVLPIYQEANLALINPTVSAEYIRQEENHHLFPLLYGDGEQAAFLAAYTKKGLGLATVAVLSDESVYGNLLRDSFIAEARSQGLELVAKVSINRTAAEAARAVALLKDANPEAIFLAVNPDAARLFLLERQRQSFGGKVLGPDRLADFDFYEMAGKAAEGLLVCQPILLDKNSGQEGEFVRRFELINQLLPDWIAAGGYDAMRLAMEVLQRSGPGRTAFLRTLRKISGPDSAFRSLGGPVFFRKGGTSRRQFYVAILQQGRLHTATPPTVEFLGSSSR